MNRQLLTVIIVILIALLPLAIADSFFMHLLVRAFTYSIVIMGFTLFVGYTGQISVGHAAYFGIGGYLAGILAKNNVPFLFSLLITIVVVAIIGFIIGLMVLRTSGHYLALSSIAVAMIFYVIIINMDITGGPSGLAGVPYPSLFGFEFSSVHSFYVLVLVILALGYIIITNIINSRTGDALRAIANNELAAESLGIPVFKYKVTSFTVSTVFAGVAGVLFVYYDGYLSPETLDINISILFLTMAFIGGIGNIKGSIIGALAITFIEEYARNFGDFHVLIYGLLLALIILFLPRGLVDVPNQLKFLFSRMKTTKQVETSQVEKGGN